MRVRDDVVWGLPPEREIDVVAALDHVGLAAFADRETATLSGGELQRLAIAAALVRRPGLLLSDESTAMVDHDGRDDMMRLFGTLTSRDHLAVVHVTHDRGEARGADRVVSLAGGKLDRAPDAETRRARTEGRFGRLLGDECLRLDWRSGEMLHSCGSPWAHRCRSRSFRFGRRRPARRRVERLREKPPCWAWILAGLVIPSEGQACLEGRPLRSAGRLSCVVAPKYSAPTPTAPPHRRRRHRVGSGAGRLLGVSEALELVGLDPSSFRDRRIDELSGGEQTGDASHRGSPRPPAEPVPWRSTALRRVGRGRAAARHSPTACSFACAAKHAPRSSSCPTTLTPRSTSSTAWSPSMRTLIDDVPVDRPAIVDRQCRS